MTPSEDKGKTPQEPTDKDKSPSSSQVQNPSLLSRITASASALSQSAFTGAPTRSELHATAHAALPDTSKASSSSSTSRGSGSGNLASEERSRAAQSQGEQNQGGIRGSNHTEEQIAQSEREFSSFLDGIDSFTPSSGPESIGVGENKAPIHSVPGGSNIALGNAWDDSSQYPYSTPRNLLSTRYDGAAETVEERQMRDGEDVRAILSSPDHSSLEEFPALSLGEETPNWGLSHDQITEIRGLMSEIFPPSALPQQYGGIDPEHPLNLAPVFDIPGLKTGTQEESAC